MRAYRCLSLSTPCYFPATHWVYRALPRSSDSVENAIQAYILLFSLRGTGFAALRQGQASSGIAISQLKIDLWS